jgi:hypothetical protein
VSTASGDDYLVADQAPAIRAARVGPSVESGRAGQWPFLLVLVTLVAGISGVTAGRAEGLVVIAVAMGLASLLRLTLPDPVAGWLCSRRRFLDAGLFAILAGALLAVSWTAV